MNEKKEVVLRINPEELSIRVENRDGDIVSFKEITANTLFECIKSSIPHNSVSSGFLPPNCFHIKVSENGDRTYSLMYPELYADISYFNTEYTHFPLPRLVFGFTLTSAGKIHSCRLGVMEDKAPDENTKMYIYPFSNVSARGFHLCVGNNALPTYKRTVTLATLPGYLLMLPNNNDSFNANNNRLHMQYRELLDHLRDKDPSYYYSDVLIPNDKTLKDFTA